MGVLGPYVSIDSTQNHEHMENFSSETAYGHFWTCHGENLLLTRLTGRWNDRGQLRATRVRDHSRRGYRHVVHNRGRRGFRGRLQFRCGWWNHKAATRRKTVKELLLHTRVSTILPGRVDVHTPRTGCVFPPGTCSEGAELDAKLSTQKCSAFRT